MKECTQYNIIRIVGGVGHGEFIKWISQWSETISKGEGSFAFWRHPPRESLGVSTILVYHVVLSHPLEPLLLLGVQNLLLTRVRRSNNIEVVEWCNKGGFSPVGLNESTFGFPIIFIPRDGLYPHCLVVRIIITHIHSTQLFISVLEHSNSSSINIKTE